MRASSSDPKWQDGNGDARPIAPGGTLTLAELEVLASSRTSGSRSRTMRRSIRGCSLLRMFWTARLNRVWSARWAISLVSGTEWKSRSAPFPSGDSDGRGRNCYWPNAISGDQPVSPLPTRASKGATHFTIISTGKASQFARRYGLFSRHVPAGVSLPDGTQLPAGRPGGRGHYAGTIQSVYHMSSGWYVKGMISSTSMAAEPQLRGTGTEDYFCDGWGFRQQDGPFTARHFGKATRRGTGARPIAFTFLIRSPLPSPCGRRSTQGLADVSGWDAAAAISSGTT